MKSDLGGYDVFWICCICWNDGRLEKHHISGRVNHTRVIPICSTCHRILTRYQFRAGIKLEYPDGTDIQKLHSIVFGYQAVLNLFTYKSGLNMSQDIRSISPELKPPNPLYAFGTSDE